MAGVFYRQTLFGEKQIGRSKKSWSTTEDTILQNLVATHGMSSWTKISSGLEGRTGKQCRERYHNHLHPDIIKGDWTEAEDRLIVEMQEKMGNKWAEITKMLPGRTDNAVKNRWHAAMRSVGRPVYESKDSSSRREAATHNKDARVAKKTKPVVPALPLHAMHTASASCPSSDGTECDDCMGGTGDIGDVDGHHHSSHAHGNSARTEPPRGIGADTARQMLDDSPRPGAFLTDMSPRTMEFLSFPLSSYSNSSLLTVRSEDSDDEDGGMDDCPPDLLAEGSPRDVARWLSMLSGNGTSPRLEDPFSARCHYISSPGHTPLRDTANRNRGQVQSRSQGYSVFQSAVNAKKMGSANVSALPLFSNSAGGKLELEQSTSSSSGSGGTGDSALNTTRTDISSFSMCSFETVEASPHPALFDRDTVGAATFSELRRGMGRIVGGDPRGCGSLEAAPTDYAPGKEFDACEFTGLDLEVDHLTAFARLEVSPRWDDSSPRLSPRAPTALGSGLSATTTLSILALHSPRIDLYGAEMAGVGTKRSRLSGYAPTPTFGSCAAAAAANSFDAIIPLTARSLESYSEQDFCGSMDCLF